MRNTFLHDVDLVFHRVPDLDDSDLTDIEFADLEPVDVDELVGVRPCEAIASVPVARYELVGVPGHHALTSDPTADRRRRPFAASPPVGPEDLPTEEYLPSF